MKISTKGRYALRLMLELALDESQRPISIKEIAARQQISDKYLEQIISILNSAGFVRGVRGPQGGYVLEKAPKDYTVGMILRLTEGSLAPVSCVESEGADCGRTDCCATMYVWKQISDAVNNVVDEITLEDLVKRQKNNDGEYL